MNDLLKKDYEFIIANKSELLEKYYGKFLVIKNCEVVAFFDTFNEAMIFAISKYEIGTFTVQMMDEMTFEPRIFHSRVRKAL